MDFDEIEIQPKFPKISKISGKSMKISNEEEKGADRITAITTNGWISSRIVRVSRLTGGKDRHSKVLTSKGLRDRRVRLSVSTAIQFYDLQDRLGFDQPSKALEWLLKAAASSITELPPMSTLFPDGPNYDVNKDENATTNGGGNGKDVDSASETSKNSSGLTLCRSDQSLNRAPNDDTKLGEIENENNAIVSQTTSFTELLSSRSNHNNSTSSDNGGGRLVKNELNVFEKRPHWPLSPMDYFTSGFFNPLGTPVASPMFSFDHYHLSLPPDNTNRHNLSSGNEYNLNFTMSSSANSLGLTTTGLNRGTLQSNSTSSQRLIPLSDGGSPPPSFYVGAAENHHQLMSGFDGRFQLSYGDAGNNNGQKGKRKN